MNLIQRWMLSLAGAGLLACSSDSRNEPSPAQMCENLASECSGFQSEVLNDCQRIGEQGKRQPSARDACFVYYDTCIDQCRFYREFGEGLDGGAEAGAPDAGASSSAPDAAAASAPDAALVRDGGGETAAE